MAYSDDILKLRKRVADAVSKGIVGEDKDFYEASLIQIMNDAEKNRQNCLTQAENLRRQAGMFDGQASAFASVVSIVYNVINGYVSIAEKDEQEKLERNKQNQSDVLVSEEEVVLTPKKKTKKSK